MRKLVLSVLCSVLFCVCLIAQKTTVTGKVKDSTGASISGASVRVKGTKQGVSAGSDGSFSVSVDPGATLVVSAAGFVTREVSSSNAGDIILSADVQNLSEVVVTALGIRRNKNTLPYAAQQINGEDISKVRTGNAASALSGKISGLEIRQGNSIGGSTNIVIRGSKSLTGSNQALFVVDGVPIDNSNTNTTTQRNGGGGYDYGNAAADINPDDIATMTVLKGAAATALYGSRAANGVIMITTKQGKKGMGITINAGLTIGTIDKKTFPEYQSEYGAGYSSPYQKDGFLYFDADGNGTLDLVVNTAEDASYGTKFDPNLMVFQWDAFDPASPTYKKARPWVAAKNNPASFYETAISNNTSIMLDGANDKGSYKLGYTRNDENGILPNSNVTKNIINFGASYNIVKGLTASASVNYSKVDGKGRYGTGYSGLNVNQNFRQWYQTNVDIQEQKEAYFRQEKNITWNWADPSTAAGLVAKYTDNYYWTRYQNFEKDTRSRTFGNVALNYKVTDWLNILGRVSVDTYSELQEERIAVGGKDVAKYSRFDRNFSETNYDLMANFDKNIGEDFNIKALVGTNIRRLNQRSISSTTNGGLVVPGLYSISNSKGTVAAPIETVQPINVDGYFAGITLGYKEFLTLDGTVRRDRNSTLPDGNNAYNYYAASGSWLFSKHVSAPWLSSGKLRLNYATVGNGAPFASLYDTYSIGNPFGNSVITTVNPTKNNPNLRPEKTTSKEIGLEASFFHNRVGFDVTYYRTNTIDQLIPVSVSTSTGYNSKYLNAGDVQNQGVELSVFATPIKTRDFSWNINLNWTRNRNKVVSLFDTSKNLQISSHQSGVTINATLGQPYGTIQGKTHNLVNGQPLVNANGTYSITSTTTNVIGDVNPDWIGGMYNTFTYKAFSLGFLIDVRKGGDLYSLDQYYGYMTGVYATSVGLNDIGKPVRDDVSNGGGIILPGVTADGKPNTTRVNWNADGPSRPNADYVYDAGYVKLREAVLSYSIPSTLISKTKFFKGAQLSIIGRNLWIIHKNLPYADPEENLSSGNSQGNQSGAYPTTRSIGFNLKLIF
jgi:TonB-linked SusC/RagA family outer membrane protein